MSHDKRAETLKGVYLEMDESKQNKIEQITKGLLDVQIMAEMEKFADSKEQE